MPNQKRQRKKQGRQARLQEIRAQQQRAARRRKVIFGAGVAGFVVLMAILFSRGDSSKAKKVAANDTTSTTAAGATSTTGPGDPKVSSAACPAADGSAEKKISFEAAPPMCIEPAKSYTARVETDAGAFTVVFDAKKAPNTVNNFVFLARHHFYDGVPFHRVIPGFVVQGGDAEKGNGTGGPGYTFADELPKAGEYEIGSLAMANSGPNTNGSQFFVITGPQGSGLPPKYSLFARVSEGLDVVKKIEADGTQEGTPKVVHKMTKITISEK
ncbi:MAG TPA: peptidylprolyl isomerase [Acidimicrobiales bacterium]|nr:peptidylprolyl isomerase [Acidimicrobiales bacterium]